jgi:hypothetical protein
VRHLAQTAEHVDVVVQKRRRVEVAT